MTKWIPPGPALLVCPGNKPELFDKAAERADAVILDLEDAVAPRDRDAAREAVAASRLDPAQVIVRVNPTDSPDHEADLECVRATEYACVMVAKSEKADDITSVAARTRACVLALVETPLGIVRAEEIAAALGCGGMTWGAEDLVAAMGGRASRFDHLLRDAPNGQPERLHAAAGARPGAYRDLLRYARARVAMAAAAFGRWAVDGVHMDFTDLDGLRAAALDAFAQGFAATACIHPAQVPVIREAYTPAEEDLAWARRVLAAAEEHGGAVELDGRMVDGPMYRQAEVLLRRIP
ncbi:MAG: CoA ester lyase [Propionibacteriaceae bacterium]|nr:CoA ester lyase [Propionibacteriaceae bacterium]